MKFRFIPQYDSSDCGAACVSMICRFYGLKKSITEIREIIGTDKNGTSAFGIVNGCKKLNLDVDVVKLNHKIIDHQIFMPCIAQTQNEIGDHYLVIYKKAKEYLIIADPAVGVVRKSRFEFSKNWSGVLFFIKPNKEFKTENTSTVKNIWLNILKHEFNSENISVKRKGNLSSTDWENIKFKKSLIRLTLLSGVGILLGILGSFYYKFLIDNVLPKKSYYFLKIVSLIFMLIGIFETVLLSIQSYLFFIFGQKIDIKLVLKYYRHILNLPLNFFETRDSGDILSRINDVYEIKNVIVTLFVNCYLNFIMLIGCSITLCSISIKLFLVTLVTLVIYISIILFFRKKLRKQVREKIEQEIKLNTTLIETILGIETIKALGLESHFTERVKNIFKKCLDKCNAFKKTESFESFLISFISKIGSILTVWFGIFGVIHGNISFGEFLTFNALLVFFLQPANELILFQSQMQLLWFNLCRLSEVLALPAENRRNSNKIPQSLIKPIKIINVDFRYGSRQLVLKNFNMEIKAGEKVAIIGPSGSGKSTISKLILNFYTPENGKIMLGDEQINKIDVNYLRKRIAYLPQKVVLFSGSLEKNLKQKNPNISEENFTNVCRKCEIDKLAAHLPGGYQFKITEQGMNFSGGQRQILAFARAIMKKPDIVILDEATSNMDSITESKLIKLMFEELKDSTIIMIAHKLTTTLACQKVFVLQDGRVIASGTDSELKKNCLLYNQLWTEYQNF